MYSLPSAIIALFLLMTLGVQPCLADETITEVISTSPSWDKFTNRNGTGLYHEVLSEVFGLYGVKVRHEYGTSERAEELVMTQEADFMTCDDRAKPPLVLAKHPLYINDFYVFYKTSHFTPWKGVETIRDHEVLSQAGFYFQDNFPVPVKLKYVISGGQAVDMISMDRSDFYVDDLTLIKQSLADAKEPLNMSQYSFQVVGRRSYYPMFKNTPRGLKVMEMYDQGMETLHKQGRLRKHYEKWGFQYPYDDSM